MARLFKSIYYTRRENWDDFNLIAENGDVPFHYSVRPNQGMVVINGRIGGAWGEQHEVGLDFTARQFFVLTTIVADLRVYLLVDGAMVHRHDLDQPIGDHFSIKSSMRCLHQARPWGDDALRPGRDLVRIDGIDQTQLRGYRATLLIAPAEPKTTRRAAKSRAKPDATSAAAPAALPSDVVVTLAGRTFFAALGQVPRPEQAIIGDATILQGFEVALDADAGAEILAAINDHAHPIAVRLSLGDAGEGVGWINPPGAVERFEDFCVEGWVNRPADALPTMTLRVGGVEVAAEFTAGAAQLFPEDCLIMAPQPEGPLPRVRFRAKLPSAIWTSAAADAAKPADPSHAVDLEILCGGVPLLAGDLNLMRSDAARWIEQLAAGNAGPPSADLLDLMFGHVAAADLWPLLSAPVAEKFASLRRERAMQAMATTIDVLRMNMQPSSEGDPSIDLVDEDGEFLLHIKARRADNLLIYNRTTGGKWGAERVLGCLPADQTLVRIDIEIRAGEAVVLVNYQPWAMLPVAGVDLHEVQLRGARALKRRGRLRLPPAHASASVGVVELIEDGAITGWVRDGFRAGDFEIDLGDGPVALAPVWTEQANPHFTLGLPADLVEPMLLSLEALRHDLFTPHAPRLSLGGKPVTLLPEIPEALAAEGLAFGWDSHPAPDRETSAAAPAVGGFEPNQDRALLEAWLKRANQAAKPQPIAGRGADIESVLVRRARQLLGQRIAAPGDPIFGAMREVAEEQGLVRGRLEAFCLSLAPNLCRTDELPQLNQIMRLTNFFHHAESADGAAVAAAAAMLAAEGQIDRAAEALERLADLSAQAAQPASASCVAFALRQVERLVKGGHPGVAAVQRFRAAVLTLIEAMDSGWSSLLHDRQMVEAMVLLLGRREVMPDRLAQRALGTAMKYFGLSPAFWHRWTEQNPSRDQNRQLWLAHEHFARLADALGAPERIDAGLAAIAAALRFFRARGNPETLYWMREIAAHALRPGAALAPGAVTDELAILLEDLRAVDPAELLRAAALPTDQASAEVIARSLPLRAFPELLGALSGEADGSFYRVQRQLHSLLADPATGLAGLSAHIATLAGADAGYVGAELPALLAARGETGKAHAVDLDLLLARFDRILLDMLEGEPDPSFPPAPFMAGLMRWRALQQRLPHPRLAEMCGLFESALRTRFGAFDDLPPAAPVIAIDDRLPGGDTLVVVCSSQSGLASRVPALRAGFMAELKARGIPCVAMAGGGDNRLDQDVLRLAASDAPEARPARMLALLRWVVKHTGARYLLMVDDGCHLSVADYFGTLEYRAHHYSGRVVEHHNLDQDAIAPFRKALLQAAKMPADPLPAVSRFADGGAAICLSRLAVIRAIAHATTREGRRLIVRAQAGDQLLGDLLKLAAIRPTGQGCGFYQRGSEIADRLPVGRGEDGFFPSQLSPTKLVRLAVGDTPARIQALRDRPELAPKKIWNSHQAASIEAGAFRLELLSDPTTIAQAAAQPLGVICALHNEIALLPHFLAHYRALGVKSFYVIDDGSTDGSRADLLAQPDVVLYGAPPASPKLLGQHAVLSHHFLGRWALLADADELLIHSDGKSRPLADVIKTIEAEGADAMAISRIDMYPFGRPEEADFTKESPFEACPWFDRDPVRLDRLDQAPYGNRPRRTSALLQRLAPDAAPAELAAEKIALFRYHPWLRLAEGLQGAANAIISAQTADFACFKRHAPLAIQPATGFGMAGTSVRLGENGLVEA